MGGAQVRIFEQRYELRLRLGLAALAVVLVVWIFMMGVAPQGHAEVRNWSSSWIGLDVLEFLGLLGTALLYPRRPALLAPVAAATATLFGIDAWFDTMTALAGADWYTAWAFALVAEVPLTALLATLAIRSARRLDRLVSGPEGVDGPDRVDGQGGVGQVHAGPVPGAALDGVSD
ncbi:hypothetical protein [Kitasatospora sp. NBC_01302]|uniref:hypothetical protein n=1 Tax=Kitasatospora sp. NBC_01302 TaxID=2903575 RepID=UPI002E109431|nr:hypothetical protein OG294_04025 [Kitasatospora sp. NBC_01302]